MEKACMWMERNPALMDSRTSEQRGTVADSGSSISASGDADMPSVTERQRNHATKPTSFDHHHSSGGQTQETLSRRSKDPLQ